MAVRFRARKPWEGKRNGIEMERLACSHSVVWSGGMDCQLFQWDFSRGTPMKITSMCLLHCIMDSTAFLTRQFRYEWNRPRSTANVQSTLCIFTWYVVWWTMGWSRSWWWKLATCLWREKGQNQRNALHGCTQSPYQLLVSCWWDSTIQHDVVSHLLCLIGHSCHPPKENHNSCFLDQPMAPSSFGSWLIA